MEVQGIFSLEIFFHLSSGGISNAKKHVF